MRVAEIVSATDHPNADKLLVLTLRIGNKKRQLVAGLKKHYSPSELEGKKIIMVYNLEPAKLRGKTSEGMLLASENENGVVGLLTTDASSGTKLRVGDKTGQQSRITFEEFLKHDIVSTPRGVTVDKAPLTGADISVDKQAYGTVR